MPLLSPQPASQTALPTTADPLAHHHTHLSHPELWVGKGGRKDWGEGVEGEGREAGRGRGIGGREKEQGGEGMEEG